MQAGLADFFLRLKGCSQLNSPIIDKESIIAFGINKVI